MLHGVGVPVEEVRVTLARIVPRTPVRFELEKGKEAVEVWLAVKVNGVAFPIAVPVAFKKEIEPAQKAVVPEAAFSTMTLAVSVLPRPNGGRVVVCVRPVLLWLHAEDALIVTAAKARILLFENMFTSQSFSGGG